MMMPSECSKSLASSQSQEIDVTMTNIFHRLFKPGRGRIIAMSVIGFIVLAVIAATTVGVLYQQGTLTNTDPNVIADEWGQKSVEDERVREEEQAKADYQQAVDQTVEAVQTESARTKYWFGVRSGVFFGMLFVNVMFCIPIWLVEGGSFSEAWTFILALVWFVLQLAVVIAMGILDGTSGALYGLAALSGGTLLMIALCGLKFMKVSRLGLNLFNSVAKLSMFLVILMLIGPIIHMSILGFRL